MQKSRWFDACWFLACLVASSAWCLTAARQLSATFDEPLYIERGLECWRTGSHAGLMKLGTMPLPIDCDTLPLYVYERWSGTQLDSARDLNRVLPWARTAALVFWWLLLTYAWLAARSMAGPWGGRVAVAWIASEPNLLAHASLATTDIAVSACLLALVYHFYTGRERGWCRRVGLPGAWFGLAVLAKASALVFGPLCLLAVECLRFKGLWRTYWVAGAELAALDTTTPKDLAGQRCPGDSYGASPRQ
ncbi:MAG: ArnT family glycosyltransferase [Pirellulales bacterium]